MIAELLAAFFFMTTLTGALITGLVLSLKYSHRWVYRNPFDRRCNRCGRHENGFYYGAPEGWRWEPMREGSGNCCHRKDEPEVGE